MFPAVQSVSAVAASAMIDGNNLKDSQLLGKGTAGDVAGGILFASFCLY